MNVSANPFSSLSDEGLKEMCVALQEKDSCLCAGKKSTHAWFPQAVNNSAHHGPGCEDTITYGDGEECLLATMCHNKYPEIQLPLCFEGNACMYPLWIGQGSGLEVLQHPDDYACNDWSCLKEDIQKPPRWHTGENPKEHIKNWKDYCEKLKLRGSTSSEDPPVEKPKFKSLVADSEYDLCVDDEYRMFEKYVFKVPTMSTDGVPGTIDVQAPRCSNSKTNSMEACTSYSCPFSGGTVQLTIRTKETCPVLQDLATNEGLCQVKASPSPSSD